MASQIMSWGRHRMRVGAIAFATILAATACASSTSAGGGGSGTGLPAGNIKLGAILSLSGTYAEYGLSIKGALNVAVQQVNSDGGADGHKITLDIENDEGNPSTAVQLAEKLVAENVAGITYAGFPNVYTLTVPIFMKAKIPVFMIDPTGTMDSLGGVKKFPYFFNNYAAPQAVSGALARAIPAGAKVAIIGDGTPNAVGQIDAFTAAAGPLGVRIVKQVTYSDTAVDVTSQLREAQGSGATVLVVLTGTGYQMIWDGLRAVGWTPTIYTSPGAIADGASAIGNLASHIDYACAPVTLGPGQQPDASLNEFMTGLEKTVGGPATQQGTSPSIGDSVFAFAAAISEAQSTNGTKLKDTFESWTHKTLLTNLMYYTFTPTDHDGVPAPEVGMCSMGKFAPDGLPIRTTMAG
jgi:branched-chain amino acid transport system substrate-binding protein